MYILDRVFIVYNPSAFFLPGKVKEMVYIENDVGGKNMVPVFMDITIMELSCEHVSLDIQDGHGRYEIDEHHIKKKGDETTEEKHPEVVKVGEL